MWKKGNKIIAIDDKLFEPDEDDRTKLEKVENGNKLTIKLAGEDDAGEYLCQVTAAETIELVHDVKIRGGRSPQLSDHLDYIFSGAQDRGCPRIRSY